MVFIIIEALYHIVYLNMYGIDSAQCYKPYKKAVAQSRLGLIAAEVAQDATMRRTLRKIRPDLPAL